MKRKEWDKYFLEIATVVATRAACDRLHAGCVLVKDKRLVATGYNCSLSGLPTCDEIGHLLINGSCLRTVHAEENAICQASRFGFPLDGCLAYITHNPCFKCLKLLISAGIKEIVYQDEYRLDNNAFDFAHQSGVILRRAHD